MPLPHGFETATKALRWPLFVALWLFLAAPSIAEERRLEVLIEEGAVVSQNAVLRVSQGDRVFLTLKSDEAMELHLHGYDIEIALEAGKAVEVEFDAHASGRFPAEAHQEGAEHGGALFYLEVYPD